MRSMSLEKNRQRESELNTEIERLQSEIKMMQRSSEEGANVSQRLSKEVRRIEIYHAFALQVSRDMKT